MEKQSEFEVNYGDGAGWQPVSEERTRLVLSGAYYAVSDVIEGMRRDPDKFTAVSAVGTLYRVNPEYVRTEAR